MPTIHGKEHKLKDIFSDQFVFTVPSYQRPYAWQTQHVQALVNDLIAFMQESSSLENLPPYFLGSIVLIKQEGIPNAEIVDGQQRLTTLTILMSVLRELIPSKRRDLTKFLYEEGNQIAGTSNRYRLTLRERDAEFFQKYIQDEGGIEKLIKLNSDELSDSQRNIQTNTQRLLERVKGLSEKKRVYLAQAMVTHCYLVEISTSDLESAYNVFSILNDRGLNLSHSDILKAQLLGKIHTKQRKKYTAKWEEAEEILGRDMFSELFNYLNIIYQTNSEDFRQGHLISSFTLLERESEVLAPFRKYVYPARISKPDPKKFIDDVLVPYVNALYIIETSDYRQAKDSKEINKFLTFLFDYKYSTILRPSIVNYLKAITMHYFVIHQNNPEEIIKFLRYLERLNTFMNMSVNRLVEYSVRMERLLQYINDEKDLYISSSPLQLTKEEIEEFLMKLDSKRFYEINNCKYILLRLDSELTAANEAEYNYITITIEHVLPQNPKMDSIWYKWFSEEEHLNYVNQLGNLVLLSKSKNSEAQNYDFEKKKRKYFLSEKGTSSFALTSQVLQEDKWSPLVIQRRQQMLLEILKNLWRLN